jgi:hypothetical protein
MDDKIFNVSEGVVDFTSVGGRKHTIAQALAKNKAARQALYDDVELHRNVTTAVVPSLLPDEEIIDDISPPAPAPVPEPDLFESIARDISSAPAPPRISSMIISLDKTARTMRRIDRRGY